MPCFDPKEYDGTHVWIGSLLMIGRLAPSQPVSVEITARAGFSAVREISPDWGAAAIF